MLQLFVCLLCFNGDIYLASKPGQSQLTTYWWHFWRPALTLAGRQKRGVVIVSLSLPPPVTNPPF